MSKQVMTQEEKEMAALFRSWLRNPTNPRVMKRLVWNMVDFELKCRLKNPPPPHIPRQTW
ncbi:MAG TPA: hypothetical protein VJ654_07615 [Noviherbaspirillum sp.]|nr:hypothetical protein [Noviherbaspirillum sp.]